MITNTVLLLMPCFARVADAYRRPQHVTYSRSCLQRQLAKANLAQILQQPVYQPQQIPEDMTEPQSNINHIEEQHGVL